MFVCTVCHLEKPQADFYWDAKKDRPRWACKQCWAAKQKAYRSTDKGKVAVRRFHLMASFGITEVEYDALFEKQNGQCAICGTTRTKAARNKFFAVDHDHDTGEVRGLLCFICNTRLGWYEQFAGAVARYLNRVTVVK